MKYSTLIPLALACFQSVNAIVGRAHCTDKCAMAIASDGNKAVHKSLMSDCDAFLGTTYYPTTSVLHTATVTMIRNNDGPTLAANNAEESKYSAHLNQKTPVATTQVVSSTAPPHYAAELCQQPLLGFQPVFRAYSSACVCGGVTGVGADAPAYTKIYTKNEVRLVSRFKILAIPEEENVTAAYLNVKIDGLTQQGGSVPVHLTNNSREASVFEFTADHNLRLYHSELLAGSDREFVNSQVAGKEIRYASFEFGWSPTVRLSKYLVPRTFIVDLQAGKLGYQLRTIVNETVSTDLVGVDESQVVHLPVGDRWKLKSGQPTKELNSFYRLEAVELE